MTVKRAGIIAARFVIIKLQATSIFPGGPTDQSDKPKDGRWMFVEVDFIFLFVDVFGAAAAARAEWCSSERNTLPVLWFCFIFLLGG